MAHLHNYYQNQKPGLFESVGHKMKFGAEIAGEIKLFSTLVYLFIQQLGLQPQPLLHLFNEIEQENPFD